MTLSCEPMLRLLSGSTGVPIAVRDREGVVLSCGTFEPNPALDFGLKHTPPRDGLFCSVAPAYLFLGCVRFGEHIVVAGPVSAYDGARRTSREVLAFFNLPAGRELEVTRWFRSLPPCNLPRFHEVLRLIGTIIGIGTVPEVETLPWGQTKRSMRIPVSPQPLMLEMDQRLENAILLAVETGNEAALERILFQDRQAAADFGYLAEDAVRSFKNTFIMTTAIVSRAAIHGGLDYSTAILRADEYLLHIEQLQTYPEILDYIRHMFLEYTRLVARAHKLSSDSSIVSRVSGYVLRHLSEPVQTSDLAAHLHLNRSYLCRHFRQKTGMTISAFVTGEKVREAERLLVLTSSPISEIATQLGFATQNYFISVFRKASGTTPAAYRRTQGG